MILILLNPLEISPSISQFRSQKCNSFPLPFPFGIGRYGRIRDEFLKLWEWSRGGVNVKFYKLSGLPTLNFWMYWKDAHISFLEVLTCPKGKTCIFTSTVKFNQRRWPERTCVYHPFSRSYWAFFFQLILKFTVSEIFSWVLRIMSSNS